MRRHRVEGVNSVTPTSAIIFNPTARGDKARELIPLLEELSREAVLHPTHGPGDARRLARDAVLNGAETIVAAGGDGTVNEVINGLAEAECGLERSRLGVLPLGTVNVFAKEVGIPEDLRAAWEVIRHGREWRIDLPQASFIHHGQPVLRSFVQLAGAGLDSRAIANVRWTEKKRLGQLAYALAGIRALCEHLPQLRVTLPDGREDSGELILIGNGRFYGGRFPVFQNADMADGLLDLVVVPKVNLFRVMRLALASKWDYFANPNKVRHYQMARCQIRSDRPCEFQLEGDNIGVTPLSLAIQHRALRLLVPSCRAQ
jgi:diacylglycerol kinase (ATP)